MIAVSAGRPLVIGVLDSLSAFRGAMLRAASLDMLEFRADLIMNRRTGAQEILAYAARCRKKGPRALLTVRRREEGGGTFVLNLGESRRAGLYSSLLNGFDAADIELLSPAARDVSDLVRSAGKGLILSFHDFRAMPSWRAMDSLLSKSQSLGCDICKIAVTAGSYRELTGLASWTEKNGAKGVITIAMGRFGAFGRYMMWPFGSKAVYGSVTGHPVLPGQIDVRLLSRLVC